MEKKKNKNVLAGNLLWGKATNVRRKQKERNKKIKKQGKRGHKQSFSPNFPRDWAVSRRISHRRLLVRITNPAQRVSGTCLTPALCFSTPHFPGAWLGPVLSPLCHLGSEPFGPSLAPGEAAPALRAPSVGSSRQHSIPEQSGGASPHGPASPAEVAGCCSVSQPSKATTGSTGLGIRVDRDPGKDPGIDLVAFTAS